MCCNENVNRPMQDVRILVYEVYIINKFQIEDTLILSTLNFSVMITMVVIWQSCFVGGHAGWICYAEKTHGSYILPHISTTKSPQQVMGSIVKSYLPAFFEDGATTPDKLYHVTVMPCYDKKLEASRQDFYNDIYSTQDVDCVITTGQFTIPLIIVIQLT